MKAGNDSAFGKTTKTQVADNVAYFHSEKEAEEKMRSDTWDNVSVTGEGRNIENRTIGQILVESRRINVADAERISQLQKQEGIYFGEAAKRLRLIGDDDIQFALSKQFNFPYLCVSENAFSSELVTAYKPFCPQSDALRGIRSHVSHKLADRRCNAFSIVSPGVREGRSYLAANLAVSFSQMEKRTLLIDANLRTPRLHTMFEFTCRVGLSAMLAGRVKQDDLEHLPETIPFFTHLSVLGAGAIPPNPLELLAGNRFPRIVGQLSQYFDIIIIDTPSGQYHADFQPISIAAGNALLIARKDHTKIPDVKKQTQVLTAAGVHILGAVFSQF